MLTKYLDDLEQRIDPVAEELLFSQWKDFLDNKTTDPIFSPTRNPIPPTIDWPHIPVNDTLDDFDLMALQQFADCSHTLAHTTGQILNIRANYGTSILPSLFGVELFIMERSLDTLPTSHPLPGNPDTINKLLDKGIPDIHQSLAGKSLEMTQRFLDMIKPYPNLSKHIHIYHPDLQGPMDVCEIIWGSSIFTDLLDHPDLVHSFLQLITDTYIKLMKAWHQIVPPTPDYSPHWGFLHKGTILLRDDSAMNLSPAMFEYFIEPYEQQLLNTFNSGVIHFCGRGDHFIHRMPEMKNVTAIAMSQPEYNNMETIFQHTIDRNIKLINLPRPAAEQALASNRDFHNNVHCW